MGEIQYFEAAQNNDVTTLQKLISKFHNRIESTSEKTALQLALENGAGDVLRILLPREATLFNELNYTPLMAAARAGNLQYTRALIENANNELYGSFDWLFKSEYAVEIALRFGHLKVAEYLSDLEREADVNRQFLEEISEPGINRVFDTLQRTPLMYAVNSGNCFDIMLFQHYFGYQDLNGVTALMFAVISDNMAAISHLAPKESKIQAICSFMQLSPGYTALMLAAVLERHEAIAILLADELGMCDCDGKCAVDYYEDCELLASEKELTRTPTRSLTELKEVNRCGAQARSPIENRCLGSPELMHDLLTYFQVNQLGELLSEVKERELALVEHEKSRTMLSGDDSRVAHYVEEINAEIKFLEPQLDESNSILRKLREEREIHFPLPSVDFCEQFKYGCEDKASDCCNLLVETCDNCTFMEYVVVNQAAETDVTCDFFSRFQSAADTALSFLQEKEKDIADERERIENDMQQHTALLNTAIARVSAVSELSIREQIRLLQSGFEESGSPNVLVKVQTVADANYELQELEERREELVEQKETLESRYKNLDSKITAYITDGLLIETNRRATMECAISDISDESEE